MVLGLGFVVPGMSFAGNCVAPGTESVANSVRPGMESALSSVSGRSAGHFAVVLWEVWLVSVSRGRTPGC